MSRMFKYQVTIKSRPGLAPRYHGIVTVVAASPLEAEALAIKKAASGKFKFRDSKTFWQILNLQEIGDAGSRD